MSFKEEKIASVSVAQQEQPVKNLQSPRKQQNIQMELTLLRMNIMN
jgi:hypothetical protein